MLNDEEKKNLNHRLKRILGQVEAIGRMIEEDAYCVDTLMQVSAARGALGRVGEIVLQEHLKSCVRHAMQNGDEAARDTKLDELMVIFRKYSQ